MKIVLATNSKNKVREMKEILEGINGIDEILTMAEIGFKDEIKEDGENYADNARIKAMTVRKYICKNIPNWQEYIIIADDSGLEIEALCWAPGIYSHRFLGIDADQDTKNQKIVDLLNGLSARNACYKCFMMIYFPSYIEYSFSVMQGYIGNVVDRDGKNGFGYDPIFYVDGVSCASMDHETKLKLNHRYNALKGARKQIEKYIEINNFALKNPAIEAMEEGLNNFKDAVHSLTVTKKDH